MDCKRVGRLIRELRHEKGLTQKQLADMLYLSDRTISKWERGSGCPDVSLLGGLSAVFGVNIEKILAGDLSPNESDGGNMKRIKFYMCPECGNIITATGEADISCCGRQLEALTPKPAEDGHRLCTERVEGELYVTLEHEMTKTHYISFAAYVSYDRVMLVRLYPEQNAEIRFPALHGGKLYFGCSKHGLFAG